MKPTSESLSPPEASDGRGAEVNCVVDHPNSAPSDSAIANLEAQLKCRIPEDYRAFLAACNGGHVDYEIEVSFEDGSTESMSFCGFHPLVLEGERKTNPYELINAKHLDLRDGYRVVAFMHGLPAWTGLRQQDSLVELATNFDAYWDKLKITDSYVEDFIKNYDPKYGHPEAAAEWLDTGNPNWREKFSELWQRHVIDAHHNQNG